MKKNLKIIIVFNMFLFQAKKQWAYFFEGQES